MWPFKSRSSRVITSPTKVNIPALPEDLSKFAKNDTSIKLWLPERLIVALDELSFTTEMSRPDVLRCIFFEHVYGRPAINRLIEWKRINDLAMDLGEATFSPKRKQPSEREVTIEMIGKSKEDFTLHLPSPLKDELIKLSKLEMLDLSDYLRKTLVRILLGEVFHHQWRDAIGKLPDEVQRFEMQDTL